MDGLSRRPSEFGAAQMNREEIAKGWAAQHEKVATPFGEPKVDFKPTHDADHVPDPT